MLIPRPDDRIKALTKTMANLAKKSETGGIYVEGLLKRSEEEKRQGSQISKGKT